jgi:hypothetical protein
MKKAFKNLRGHIKMKASDVASIGFSDRVDYGPTTSAQANY